MAGAIEKMTNDVVDPATKVAMLPVKFMEATLGIDAMRGRNPVETITKSTSEAIKRVMLMPLAVMRDGVIGATTLALGVLSSTITGTAKAVGRAALNVPIVPTPR